MAKRMSNGDGTSPKYNEKTKLWLIQITINDGKRRSLYAKTAKEVITKRDKLKDELKNGCLATSDVDKMTLGTWLNEWLEVYKKGKIANNTYSLYDITIRLRISDKLKEVPLKKLRHDTLQKFINESTKTFSNGTCGIIRVVLCQSLSVAVKNKYILNNPADGLKVPPIIKKEVVPLTKEELSLLLSNRKETRNYLFYVLSAYSGARIGEVLGLSWKDIDFKNNVIHINHSLKYNHSTKKHELGITKTGKSRDIPILPKVLSVLKWHKARQTGEKLQIGTGYNLNNMVFCDYNGEYFRISTMSGEFNRAVKTVGIINATPHALRHTFVSQMISAGIANIKLISKIVGHANINITLDTYGHLMPSDTKEAFNALTNYMKDIAL